MKRFFKIFGAVVLAVALVSGGYFMGTQAGKDSISSALPKVSVNNEALIAEPSGAPEPMDDAGENPPINQNEAEENPQAQEDNTAAEPEKTGRTVVKSDQSAAESTWTTIGEYDCDLFGNGENATISLYTSAQTEDGEIIWDDSQNWAVEISDGEGGYYDLLDKYISNGTVYFEVNELEDGENAVTVFVKTGSSFEAKQYTYSDGGFVETTLYNSGSINTMYSSLPDYQ
ncbi:MAG: hypothetical protein LIO59_02250 [Oscillospiraceae bacterium]|nr:hypothetical protein [Oscillospiraceae bacterium]